MVIELFYLQVSISSENSWFEHFHSWSNKINPEFWIHIFAVDWWGFGVGATGGVVVGFIH